MIGQPPAGLAWHGSDMEQRLAQEVLQFRDVVVLPGVDAYRNLTNKTLRTLQYMLHRWAVQPACMQASRSLQILVFKLRVPDPLLASFLRSQVQAYVCGSCARSPAALQPRACMCLHAAPRATAMCSRWTTMCTCAPRSCWRTSRKPVPASCS